MNNPPSPLYQGGRIRKNQKGVILLLTLLILSSILVVTLAAADLVMAGLKMNRLTGYSNLAFFASETGLERALWEARKSGTFVLPNNNVVTDVFNCVSLGNCVLSNNSSYTVDYASSTPNVTFKSIGSYSGVKRSVESTYQGGIVIAAPTCSDGIQNQDETGVDCGGSVCPACIGFTCEATVCSSKFANSADASVSENTGVPIINMPRTLVAADNPGTKCECACDPVYTYNAGVCVLTPTCSDGIQNQGETGIDCGGPCAACTPFTCEATACSIKFANSADASVSENTGVPIINMPRTLVAADNPGTKCECACGPGYTYNGSSCVPTVPVCGDLACNGTETCSTCPGDCGACPVPLCGNGVRDPLEECDPAAPNANYCQADCTCTSGWRSIKDYPGPTQCHKCGDSITQREPAGCEVASWTSQGGDPGCAGRTTQANCAAAGTDAGGNPLCSWDPMTYWLKQGCYYNYPCYYEPIQPTQNCTWNWFSCSYKEDCDGQPWCTSSCTFDTRNYCNTVKLQAGVGGGAIKTLPITPTGQTVTLTNNATCLSSLVVSPVFDCVEMWPGGPSEWRYNGTGGPQWWPYGSCPYCGDGICQTTNMNGWEENHSNCPADCP